MKQLMKSTGEFVRKNKIFVLVAVVVIGGSFYYGSREEGDSNNTTTEIETASVQSGTISVSVSGSGQVFADSQVNIRPQVAGDGLDVVQVAVNNDQEVKEGDLIALLDASDAQKSVRDASLSLRSSEIKLKQTEYINDTKTIEDKWTRQLQEITVSQNANRLVESREDLQEYSIRAPFDGIVTDLSVEVGDSIARDEVLASVITHEMYAQISLNEVDAVKVRQGNEVELTFDALDGIASKGMVTKIDTIGTVEQGVVYFKAEISIDDPVELLRPGMSVSANIFAQAKDDVLFVPVSTLKTGASGYYVNTVPRSAEGDVLPDQVGTTSVETGISDGVVMEIVSGLKKGDRIVTKMSVPVDAETSQDGSSGLLDRAVRVPGGGGMRR